MTPCSKYSRNTQLVLNKTVWEQVSNHTWVNSRQIWSRVTTEKRYKFQTNPQQRCIVPETVSTSGMKNWFQLEVNDFTNYLQQKFSQINCSTLSRGSCDIATAKSFKTKSHILNVTEVGIATCISKMALAKWQISHKKLNTTWIMNHSGVFLVPHILIKLRKTLIAKQNYKNCRVAIIGSLYHHT